MENEIIELKKQAQSLERKKDALRSAHCLFMRANGVPDDANYLDITIVDGNDKEVFGQATREEKDFLEERLRGYGLKLVKYPTFGSIIYLLM